ncbi:hypothetical protein GP486_001109 [Trichoglossum hirsutum]|uniref:Uncharacterized protein n=1 Tax=Trichoglossum hirsutum TaxID=265104 RepID=A0A9P8RSX9_9PEZI|nr:hypothetical protein GP486_001109 [Trichoglossum hirsutum]
MQLRAQALLLFLGLLKITLAYRVDLLRYSPNIRRSDSLISSREGTDDEGDGGGQDTCRLKCSPERRCCDPDPGAEERRDLIPRTLTEPGNVGNYVIEITKAKKTVQVVNRRNNNRNSAVFKKIEGLQKTLNIGLVGLCGCTALVVCNSKAVYFAHYFENLSFEDEQDQPITFDSVIKDFLHNGHKGDDSLFQHKDVFDNAETMPFIFTPRKKGTRTKPIYDDHITQLELEVEAILPNAQQPTVQTYKPLDCVEDAAKLDAQYNGRALFQYDPDPPLHYRLYLENLDMGIQGGFEDGNRNQPTSSAQPEPSAGPSNQQT